MLAAQYGFTRGTSQFYARLTLKGLVLILTDLVVHTEFTVRPSKKDLHDLYSFTLRLQNGKHPDPVEIKGVKSPSYHGIKMIAQIFEANDPGWVFLQVKKEDGGVLFVIQLRNEEANNLASEGLKQYDAI